MQWNVLMLFRGCRKIDEAMKIAVATIALCFLTGSCQKEDQRSGPLERAGKSADEALDRSRHDGEEAVRKAREELEVAKQKAKAALGSAKHEADQAVDKAHRALEEAERKLGEKTE